VVVKTTSSVNRSGGEHLQPSLSEARVLFFNSGMKIAAGRPMRHINDDADAGIVTLNLVAALGQPGFPGEAV
jgi:hypothetical protein